MERGTLAPSVSVALTGLGATASTGQLGVGATVEEIGGGAGWAVEEPRGHRVRSTREAIRDILEEVDEDMREAVTGEPLAEVLARHLDVAEIAGKMTRRPDPVRLADDDVKTYFC